MRRRWLLLHKQQGGVPKADLHHGLPAAADSEAPKRLCKYGASMRVLLLLLLVVHQVPREAVKFAKANLMGGGAVLLERT